MPTFSYKAIDSSGKTLKGNITASDLAEANKSLHQQQLTVLEVKRGGLNLIGGKGDNDSRQGEESLGLFTKKSVSKQELILFTKQMATMVNVGIPITQALEIIHSQSEEPYFKKVIGKVVEQIRSGSSLSRAMASQPRVFNQLYTSVVQAGESSGALPKVLERLLYLIEHEAMIRSEVKSAMRYPIMVCLALIGASLVLLSFVIPKFVSFFQDSGLELPLPTRITIGLSQFVTGYGLYVVIGIALAFFLSRKFWKSERGRFLVHETILKIPLVNQVIIKASMSRFASVFAILQANGVMILESLGILRNLLNNAAIAKQFDQIQASLKGGQGISGPLRRAKYFPPLFVNMIAVGEETGRLEEMLTEISAHYDMEVKMTVKKMTDSLGPLLIVLLTGVVGFFALAIYMPMWELSKMAQ